MLLRLDNDTLKLFKDWELLVGRVDLGVALLFTSQETYFFETLEFALDIARIFLDQLGETTHVSVEIWVLSVHYYDFATYSRGNKNV